MTDHVRVQALDFSGIDVLTDDVFIALRRFCEQNKTFGESVTSLSCVGCLHLTDCAVEQVVTALPKLQTVRKAKDYCVVLAKHVSY